jgi:predicted NACHT family NTPase
MERVAAWGVENAVGFDFKTLLEDLAQENLEEYTKTFFKEGIEDWRGLGKQEQLEIALGQALREFFNLVQQELEDADCSEEGRQQYAESLRQFVHNKTVLVELGKPFQNGVLDADKLKDTWQELNLLALPDEFDWKGIAKRYKKKVDAILRESKELLAVLSDEATAEVQSYSGLIEYCKVIEQTYGYLKLDTLHTTGYSYRLQLLNTFIAQYVREVKEALPQILELPKEHLERLIKTGDLELPPEVLESFRKTGQLDAEAIKEILERYKQSYAQETTRSVLELIDDRQTYPYLVILGDPGSGKSSLVQYIALQWAATAIKGESSLPFPLLIELRRYVQSRNKQKCQNFVEFCQQSHGFIYPLHFNQLEERLRTGMVFVMFDGLDEVFEASKRDELITEIIRFTQDYPQVRVLVTSRVIGYQPQRLRDEKFRHFMLQDLEAEQIREFLARWHDLAFGTGQEGKKKQERLQQAIEESPAIRQLAGNPLLLTMMAILNRNQELPRNRVELYSQASKVLLQQWDVERALIQRDAITIDFKDKQAMLRRVAYQMQGNEKGLAGNLINAEDLEGILTGYLEKNLDSSDAGANAKSIVKQLRERNFILCFLGADYYAFVHRTFLEYFCAWEFVWRFQKEQSLSLEKLKTDVFGKHWQDESWHEVLRLIAGMIDAKFIGQIIEYLIAQRGETENFTNLFLAAKCLSELRNRVELTSTANQLFKQLQQLINYGNIISINYSSETSYFYLNRDMENNQRITKIHTQAVAAVATTWKDSPDTLPLLKQWATADENEHVRQAAVEALAHGWKDDPDTLPLLKQRATADDHEYVRRAAVEELASGWKDDPDTLPFLKQWATADDHEYVRRAAVEELASGWKDDPDTLPFLKQWATADENEHVRRVAVEELASGWKDDPDTLPFLKQRATADDHEYVRRAAVEELASGWKDDPDTLPLLKQRATADKNYKVRLAAVEELASGWKDDPDTLPFLKQRATADNDEYVRLAAVRELASGWKDDPDTLLLLKQRATADNDEYVRRVAVEELASGWKDDPDTLPLLKQRATADKNYKVRRVAVEELARGWKDDPDTLPFLKQRATADNDEDVRLAAVRELARGWKDDPDTLLLLKQRATADNDEYVRRVAVEELARGWKDDPDTLLLLKQRATADKNYKVRLAAVEELARGWKDDPDTLPFLKQRATADKNNDVRRAAVQELARGWKDDPDTLPFLKQRATADNDEDVRLAAVQELARGWKDDPDTLLLLKQRATADKNYKVRLAAVEELARGWKDDPDTLLLLKQRATADNDEDVRLAAVQELARGWKDDPDTLLLLKQRATADKNNDVRRAAVQELARGWKDDPDTLPFLKQRATADNDEDVRLAAVEELARGWKNEHWMFEFLRDRAVNDPFRRKFWFIKLQPDSATNPRQTALKVIIQHYANHPETLSLLQDRAKNDSDKKVREFAKERLENWS